MKHNPWEFISTIKTIIISSTDTNSVAHTSYSPFVENERKFYICISAMAAHTQNIINNETISIMFIEDEAKSTNLFARKRVSFHVHTNHIERDSQLFKETMKLFRNKFGNSTNIYEQLQDFQLFELLPFSGRGVFGFGEAYDFKQGDFSSKPSGM